MVEIVLALVDKVYTKLQIRFIIRTTSLYQIYS